MTERAFWLELASATITGRQTPEEHGLGRLCGEQVEGKELSAVEIAKLGLGAPLAGGSKL